MPHFFSYLQIRSKKNKTLDYILSHPESERIVKTNVSAAAKLKRRVQIVASELKKELSRRIADKMQKRKDTERRKMGFKMKELVRNKDTDYATAFPSLQVSSFDILSDIVSGAIVKRSILHAWCQEGSFEDIMYNGKI